MPSATKIDAAILFLSKAWIQEKISCKGSCLPTATIDSWA